jgi:hypothetical protein
MTTNDRHADGMTQEGHDMADTDEIRYTGAEMRAIFLEWRGIEAPCATCDGSGVRVYGSTATWRGGVGGQAVTTGVCDACWGSGDMHRRGANLRAMESAIRNAKRAALYEAFVGHIAKATGATLEALGAPSRAALEMAAELITKESRRRNLPEWARGFWGQRAMEYTAAALREASTFGKKEGHET